MRYFCLKSKKYFTTKSILESQRINDIENLSPNVTKIIVEKLILLNVVG